MADPNFLDALISRHKVESGASTPLELPPRRRLWFKGVPFVISDDPTNGRTVVELNLGGSGTITPDPDELVHRDGSGRAFAASFVGPSGAAAVLESQSGQDVHLDSADDVLIDVGANGDAVRIQVAGADRLTLTPTASLMTVEAASGNAIEVHAASSQELRLASLGGSRVRLASSGVTAFDRWVTETSSWSEMGRVTVTGGSDGMTLSGTAATQVHAASGSELRLASLGGSRMRLGTSGSIALDRWTGTAWEQDGSIQAVSDGAVFAGTDPSTTSIKFTNANAVEVISDNTVATTVNSTLTLTESDSSGTYQLAANAPMRVQPEQQTSGAGRALTIGGGAGQTPGTHLPGPLNFDLGTLVSGSSGIVDIRSGGTSLAQISAFVTDFLAITHQRTNSGIALRALNGGNGIYAEASALISLRQNTAAAGFINLSSNRWRLYGAQETTLFSRRESGSATIASATTTNVATFLTETNRVYQCIGYLTVSNDTDDQGAAYWVRAAFKNVGGTVTQIGSTQAVAADLEDAGQTGLSAVLDFSGTTIRLRLTTDSGDTVNVNGVLELHERVLA